ncbi:MAG: cyclopropane-fatty-acyl-phospholipid synthase [Candidatus Azotimanducaceae bacterium]|jgi:cyclopropane-fatty-acyl-phospholipid synthase
MKAIDLVEQGYVPDTLVRIGIRRILKQRLNKERNRYQTSDALAEFIQQMTSSPLAINTADANVQHYEVPTSFYDHVLGQHKKYSSCYFEPHVSNLSTAEETMLELSCMRAEITDGMDILELGCGWGSLTLWLGRHYPNARITAVSNSATQKDYILEQAAERDIKNIDVVTCDMNDFSADKIYDRVLSIEMFEHMRNYQLLFERISGWLKPNGKLWFHIFVHRTMPYFFQDDGETDWMARHFFTGGLMPSWDLPTQIPSAMKLENRWAINGAHYAKTCKAWLNLMDSNSPAIRKVFSESSDPTDTTVLINRWRLFFMACEELFAYNSGREWHVAHYLFGNKEL